MAGAATVAYLKFGEEQDEEMRAGLLQGDNPIAPEGLQWVNQAEESKALNARSGPFVVIAGSGMCQGGRVVHHLLNRLPDPSTIVVFTGYQASGTLGRQILERAPEVAIFGRRVQVRARIEKLNSLSAHPDQNEIMRWISHFKSPPKRTFIVHGEPPAQRALKARIEESTGWRADIPRHLERFEL
jgi:metallo-beta-lactamase family protein